jgi:hypothetical protein
MKLEFIPIDPSNQEHLFYTYELLKQRFKFKNVVVGSQKLPSFKQHVLNLKNCFSDFRLIYYKDIRLGVVAMNKNGSLTHNYDFNSLRKNIKKITRKHFEVSYAIISQYLQTTKTKKCFVQINPKNIKAFTLFIKMIEQNKPDIFEIDNIQLNLSLIS